MEKPKVWEFHADHDGMRTVIKIVRKGAVVGVKSVSLDLPASRYTAKCQEARAWLAQVCGVRLEDVKGA